MSAFPKPSIAIAGAVAVLASVLVVLSVANSEGVTADEVRLGDGAVWLPASGTNEVVRLDGLTGRISGRVGGFGEGTLTVAQYGADALVANQDAEAAYRVDGASESLAVVGTSGATGATFEGIERVVANGESAYVIAPGRQSVQAVDPETLATLGEQVSFFGAPPAATFDAIVDGEGRLVLLDLDDGVLQTIVGQESNALVDLGWSGHDAGVVLADDVPVVVDRDEGTVSVVRGSSVASLADNCAWFPDGEAAEFAGSERSDWFSVVVPSTGSLMVARVGSTDCPSPTAITERDVDFGAPVEAEGRIFVPVLSSGQVVVVDAESRDVISEVDVVDDPGTPFELVVEDEIVYFNAADSYEAGVIRSDGQVTRADKFSEGPGDPPEIGCAVGPRAVAVGQPVRFEAKHREDDDIGDLEVEWMFGDGEGDDGNPATHSFDEPGTYTATGQAGSTSLPCPEVVVTDAAPDDLSVKIQGPKQVLVDTPATYRDVTAGGVESRRWDIPKGDPSEGTDKSITVTFDEVGEAVVSLAVVRGGETQRRFVNVEVVDELDGGPTPPTSNPNSATTRPSPSTTSAPGCTAPTVQINGPTSGSVDQTVQWSMAIASNRCDLGSPHWMLTGPEPTATSANQTFSRTIGTGGTYTLSASVDYTTEAGNPATSAPVSIQVTITDPLSTSPWNGTWYGSDGNSSDYNYTFDITKVSESSLQVGVTHEGQDLGTHPASLQTSTRATASFSAIGINWNLQLDLASPRLSASWQFSLASWPDGWTDCFTMPHEKTSGFAGGITLLDTDCDGRGISISSGGQVTQNDNCQGDFEFGDLNSMWANPAPGDGDGDGVGDRCDVWDQPWVGGAQEVPSDPQGDTLGFSNFLGSGGKLTLAGTWTRYDQGEEASVNFTARPIRGDVGIGGFTATMSVTPSLPNDPPGATSVTFWITDVPPPGAINPTVGTYWEWRNGSGTRLQCYRGMFMRDDTGFAQGGLRQEDPGCTGP